MRSPDVEVLGEYLKLRPEGQSPFSSRASHADLLSENVITTTMTERHTDLHGLHSRSFSPSFGVKKYEISCVVLFLREVPVSESIDGTV